MSRYEVNKALWQVSRDEVRAKAYMDSPASFLDGRALTDEERRQLTEADIPALYASGAHPFLLYTFKTKIAGGWSFPMMMAYVGEIAHIDPPLDITT